MNTDSNEVFIMVISMRTENLSYEMKSKKMN